jgi:uncharacterized protein YuzE
MNVQFDPEADALYVTVSDAEIARTEEVKPGVILDYDHSGQVVGIEMLYVTKRARGGARPAEPATT